MVSSHPPRVSLVSLSLSSLRTALPPLLPPYDSVDVGAPSTKRKAVSSSHYGLSVDSSEPIRLVVISRLAHAKDDEILAVASQSPTGVAVLAALKAMVRRVAVTVGGADPALSESNIESLFNLSASNVHTRRLYEGGLTLPSRMSHGRARALLTAVLDALSAFRNTVTGARVGKALLTVPAIPVDTADVTEVIQAVEAEATAKLDGDASRAGTSSATASTRSESPVAPVAPIAVAATPMAIDPSLSLAANVGRLVAASLRRQLLTTEIATIDDALDTASGVLQEGDATTRHALLHSNMLTALVNPGAAYLWASCVERSEGGGVESVEAFATDVIASASDVSSVLFASAMGM
jgi:hypothetical protein